MQSTWLVVWAAQHLFSKLMLIDLEDNQAFQVSDQSADTQRLTRAKDSACQPPPMGMGVVAVWQQTNSGHAHRFGSSGPEEWTWEDNSNPKTKSFCCALQGMKDDGIVPATCSFAPALCHKACSVLAPLPCSQHFQSAVMSRGLFFVLLLYAVGFRNSLSMPHFSSLKIGRAASSLSSESCAHVWLVDAM